MKMWKFMFIFLNGILIVLAQHAEEGVDNNMSAKDPVRRSRSMRSTGANRNDNANLSRLPTIEAKLARIEKSTDEALTVNSELNKNMKNIENFTTEFLRTLRSTDDCSSKSDGQNESNQKLESLATLLTSTRSAVSDIQQNVKILMDKLKHMQSISQNVNITDPVQTHDDDLPSSCSHVANPFGGIYRIQLNPRTEPFYVNCDFKTNKQKWTIIMERFDGSINFFRNWKEYRNGFGNIYGEFWIGLEKLHQITANSLHELRIDMHDADFHFRYAKYSHFAIGNESEQYALKILGRYEGTAGDSLSYHGGQKFSTYDFDNDLWGEGNCAQSHSGGWWYNACDQSNLNGKYLNNATIPFQGIYWNTFHGANYSLSGVRMLIRKL